MHAFPAHTHITNQKPKQGKARQGKSEKQEDQNEQKEERRKKNKIIRIYNNKQKDRQQETTEPRSRGEKSENF